MELVSMLGGVGTSITRVHPGDFHGDTTPGVWAEETGSPFYWATKWGSRGGLELAKLLIDNGADVNAIGTRVTMGGDSTCIRGHPLYSAAMAVHANKPEGLELAKLLIEKGADVNLTRMAQEWAGMVGTPLGLAAAAVRDNKVGRCGVSPG